MPCVNGTCTNTQGDTNYTCDCTGTGFEGRNCETGEERLPEKSLSLRERIHTHKVFTKDQCFHLNYHKFSIKSYVFGCVLESPR